jgi:hypothetical protein
VWQRAGAASSTIAMGDSHGLRFFFKKLDKKDFVRWLIQEILDNKEKKWE